MRWSKRMAGSARSTSAARTRPRAWRSLPSKRDCLPLTPADPIGGIRRRPALPSPTASRLDRTLRADRRRSADGGAEIHQDLVPGPALTARDERVGGGLDALRGQPRPTRAGQHAADVGVDDRHILLVREREHGAGRVRADARKGEQFVERVGHDAAMSIDDRLRGEVQIARPARVSEALPQPQHVAERCVGAGRRRRERREERFPLRDHTRCLRLLEHHLGDEDRPRIARRVATAGRAAAASPTPARRPASMPAAAARSRELLADAGARAGSTRTGVGQSQTSAPSYGRVRSGANSRFQISTLRLK